MVRAIVGGREFEYTREEIESRMRGVRPETIREHVVEMLNSVYPPKQVIAYVTGWDRTSFTTMEAQRVLTRAGFVCRRAVRDSNGAPAWVLEQRVEDQTPPSIEERLTRIENTVGVSQEVIASLLTRVKRLESKTP